MNLGTSQHPTGHVSNDYSGKTLRKRGKLIPHQVTTDGHTSYPRAIRETMSNNVQHRTNTYLNNRLEQDHREVKQRYDPMRGFGNFASAARFCHAFDEWRNYFRPRHTMGETPSLLEQRRLFCEKLAALQLWMRMAS